MFPEGVKGVVRGDLPREARVGEGGSTHHRDGAHKRPRLEDVARRAGNMAAVRAAGNALGANPVPIVVPCHRVVRTGGALGGYGGGLERKRFLLDLEEGTLPNC